MSKTLAGAGAAMTSSGSLPQLGMTGGGGGGASSLGMSQRPGTSASTASMLTMSATKPGVKRQLDFLEMKVDEHTTELTRLASAMGNQGTDFEAVVKRSEMSLRGAIDDLRTEMLGMFEAQRVEMQKMQTFLQAQRNEQNILQQQAKDSHKRILELSSQLHELNIEVLGEEDA